KIIKRHQILRTTFHFENDELYQKVHNDLDLKINLIECDTNNLKDIIQNEISFSFKLDKLSLIKISLIKVSEDEYIMVVVFHHIVGDAWSCGLFIKELTEYYQAFCNEKSSDLPELNIQYTDFAIKQKKNFEQKEYQDQIEKIVNNLKNHNLFLPLPYDFKRPTKQTFNGKTINLPFSKELTLELKKLSSKLSTTLFVVLVGAFKILLSRYSNETNILTGLPISGRTSREQENLIGVFVNTIVLLGELTNDLTFDEFIKKLSSNLLDSFDTQEVPFDKVVEKLPLDRASNYSPVFQTMFVMQNIPISFPTVEGLEIDIFEIDNNTSKFDLTLSFKEMSNEISLEYNTDLFLPETINSFLENYICLLENLLTNYQDKISNLNILTDKQKNKLLNTFPRRSFRDSENITIHKMVEKSALLFPDSIALKFKDEVINYRVLNEKANKLARYFVDKGIKKGDKVAVSFDVSFEMIITLLAVLKSGACYIPLDPVLPQERIKFITEDCKPDLIITQNKEYIKTDFEKLLIYKDSDYEKYSIENLNLDINKTDNAYIIYTSGSTGTPNGVLINHHNVIRLFETTEEHFDFKQKDIWVLFHSYAFDYSIWEIWSCLRQGSTLLLTNKEMRRNPVEFYKLICQEKVTILNQTPSAFYHFSRSAIKSDLENSLRYLVLSGEALDINLLEDWYSKFDENKPKIINSYGITETTVFVTYRELSKKDLKGSSYSPIGIALSDLSMYVLDQNKNIVPRGVIGELYVGGEGLAVCYFNRDELNKKKFIKNPFGEGNLYKTGDHVKILPNDELEYIGRIDGQIKIRGHRIEIGEIESSLNKHKEIKESAVKAFDNSIRGKYLVAYIVTNNHENIEKNELKSYLKTLLPEVMIPNDYVFMESFPLTNNGKIDKRALKEPSEILVKKEIEYTPPRNEVEKILTNIVSELLEIKEVSIDTNFFDMGFHSLLIAKAHEKIEEKLKINFNMVELFNYPTIKELAKFLSNEETDDLKISKKQNKTFDDDIAIIGLAGKFPQAENIEEYWNNILNKKECIRFYTDEELLSNGVSQDLLNNPKYVKANGVIDNYEYFDASFFGYSPKEAEITDPQHRLFLEESYHALEDAGYTDNNEEVIGVFAGTAISRYLLFNISSNPDLIDEIGHFRFLLSNDKDYLSTLTAYKLNLKGPAITLQTACSTSLVAIHEACKSIQNGDCTMVLAGGVSIDTNDTGYLYQEGMIASPDGHCRPFDKDAGGIVGGSGVGIVVLKPLKKALKDKDKIYGIIKGSAINNDGSNKAGFMAPSVQGQAQVIVDALDNSNVLPNTISYIETHGTATNIGDPIEIKALTKAFDKYGNYDNKCAIGSVKANIGHLDSGAGVAGFIKTALSIYNRVIPPSINFIEPNPKIDFQNSPFYVNTIVQKYDKVFPFRAGISSFGVGGTNAHVILEEYKNEKIDYSLKKSYLFKVSAKSENSLYQYLETIKNKLEIENYNMNDLIYSLDKKKNYPLKYSVVIDNIEELKEKINNLNEVDFSYSNNNSKIVFAFSGLGTQYLKMGQELYDNELIFKENFDNCVSILEKITGKNFKNIIFDGKEEELKIPSIMQPSIFIFQYSLAKLWISKGIKPEYILGHSFGEYASACISEVITLEEALNIVFNRGILFDKVSGVMLSVQCYKELLESFLNNETEIAVNNGENLFTISGSELGIESLIEKLKEKEIKFSKLDIPHATHSYLTENILDDFAKVFENIKFKKPIYKFLSNLTGDFKEEFESDYFVKHLRNRVLFFEQLNKLKNENLVFIEIGADTTMNNLINRLFKNTSNNILSLKSRTRKEEYKTFLNSLSSLW
ncbi:MAG: amino acid adenylation domain-containing protein, partial [Candidatus Sericytochromatia bacterium]